jgi:zinc protease
VLAEEILSPSFPDSELAKARLEMKTDVMREAENTSTRAIDRLFQIVLPEGHPHRPVDPEAMIASVEAITPGEIRSFHRERYVGSAFALAIVGDVEAEEVARLVTERFGALAKGERPDFAAVPAASPAPSGSSSDAGEREVVRMPGKASCNLVLGHATTLTRSDPDYEAALLANAALGQNDLSSRIGRRVRDTEGLSYVIYSRFTLADVLDGVWLVNAFVAPENLERAYRSTREVIESYCREGTEEEELEAQKSFFAGNYNVRLGSNAGVAAALVEAERLGFTPAYLDEYPSRIRAVSLEQANAAIRTHLRPEALQVVVAGDPEGAPQ